MIEPIQAQLHVYGPLGATVLPDGTIAQVIANIYAPQNEAIVLDATTLNLYLGDPDDDDYENNIPDNTEIFCWCIGTVILKPSLIDGSSTLSFNLAVSQYVWNARREFQLTCVCSFHNSYFSSHF